MLTPKNTIFVLFGVTGDLATHKILPAINNLGEKSQLPKNFSLLGVTRQKIDNEVVLRRLPSSSYLNKRMSILTMDFENPNSYESLSEKVNLLGKDSNLIFYLSVPPEMVKNIITRLGKSSLIKNKNKKILLEKPFGSDRRSAEKLIKNIQKYFKEKEIYRIDHYLLKQISKDITLAREKKLGSNWNKNELKKIEIVASEDQGVENRVVFYEQTGALRDMVQSHLLSLLATSLIGLSEKNSIKNNLPKSRASTLKKIIPVVNGAQRGQYLGYTEEVKNPKSIVETFVSLKLKSKDPKFLSTLITLSSGKGLNKKDTYIKAYFANKEKIWREDPKKTSTTYEDVLKAVLENNQDSFSSSEEILASWKIIDAIRSAWSKNKEPVRIYKKGSTIDEIIPNP